MGLDYYRSMKSSHRVLLALLLASAGSTSLAQAPVTPAARPAASATAMQAQSQPQSRMTARLLYELLLSEFALQQGDAQTGASHMLNAARRTGDESLFKRATEMAIQSRAGPAALEATRAWSQAYPDSVEASRYQLQVLIALGRVADTDAPLRKLLAALPEAEKISFISAIPALYQRAPDRTVAAQAVELGLSDAIAHKELAPAAWTTIGRMRLQAGDPAGALSAATLGQDDGASSEWPALLALQLMTSANEPLAEALVLRHLNNPQATPEVRIGYARALVELGRFTDAHAQLDQLNQQLPDYPEGWLVKGALLADERREAEAEAALQRYLELVQAQAEQPGASREVGRSQALMMLARIAERRRDYAGAEKLLAQVDSPDQILAVQVRRAHLLARQGQLEEARQAIRAAPERRAEDARQKLLAEAQLLREHGQAEAAYLLLSAELEKSPDDEVLLYDAGMAAEGAERLADMERLFRRLIEINPEAHHAYNALGYSLADRGLRLDEARALVEKAVQLSPDDSYIQDSLGWVAYRQGRASEARSILEAAYQKRPDPEIAAHLGEVLWVLGEHDHARRIWRDGLRLDAENDTLVKTLKRLQVTP